MEATTSFPTALPRKNATSWLTLAAAVLLCLCSVDAHAAVTNEGQARKVVMNWLRSDAAPLNTHIGHSIDRVRTFVNTDGDPIYYVVHLVPSGFVVVPAEDVVEPIVAFSPDAMFDPSPDNPLGALVSQDLTERITAARNVDMHAAAGIPAELSPARGKWNQLQSDVENDLPAPEGSEMGVSSVSDVRVAPLVESRWSQSDGVYNYYTPNNYVCGCVATAMAQLMRFHQHPSTGVGTGSFTIWVNGASQSRALRGGNGAGGAYDWANMKLVPSTGTTTAQKQAIGALCHDAGVSVNMSYASGGSGADTLQAATVYKTVFGYSSAIKGYNGGSNIGTGGINSMASANLNAGLPVLFGITGPNGGHAIVCDGYGYNSGTQYHHLNMGWAGASDAWYALPTIGTAYNFNSVYKCVYNVYKTGTGEIISGRVVDAGGNPISGVTVTAIRSGGGSFQDTTDTYGIYGIAKVPSASSYTVTAVKVGVTFDTNDLAVTTGTSTDYSATAGNRWNVDFTGMAGEKAAITSPESGVTLNNSTVTFEWSAGTNVTEYQIRIGASPNAYEYGLGLHLNTTSYDATGLPSNGSTIHVRLYSRIGGVWYYNDYTYTAYTCVAAKAAMTSPANGSTLAGSSVTFEWSAGTCVTEYQIRIGSSPNAYEYGLGLHLNTTSFDAT
ncbi:MAG: C10 family peptidase, partial [Phycisphaerae bacterium]|nr:C10 family peptidase [Phycisphaerae bacterium]